MTGDSPNAGSMPPPSDASSGAVPPTPPSFGTGWSAGSPPPNSPPFSPPTGPPGAAGWPPPGEQPGFQTEQPFPPGQPTFQQRPAAFQPGQLRRSKDDRIIAGVCGGLGRAMRIDPVIFRITLAVLAVFGGIGLLIYGAAWLLMPEDGTAESDGLRLLHGRTPTTMLAAILVGVAGLVVISNFAHDSRPGGLPILLVLVIVAVLIALFRGRRPGQANQAGTGIASWSRSRLLAIPLTILILFVGFGRQHHSFALLLVALVVLLVVSPIFSQNRIPSMSGTTATAPATTTEPLGPPAGYSPSRPSYGEQPWNMAPTSAPPTPRRRAPKPPRQPSFLFPLTVSVGVVVAGVLFALGASGRVDITAQDLFAATLLTVGVGLVVAAWLGRARSLLAVGVILSIGLIVTATVNVPLRGGIGVREIGADRTSELAPAYHLGLGEQNLNLQNLQLAGRTQHLSASLGIGHLFVQVPANMKVVVHAYAGTGKTELFDVFDGGTQINHTTVSTPPDPQAGELDLDLRVGVGEVEIVRVNQGDQP